MNILSHVPTVCENNQNSNNLDDMEIRILYPTLSPNKMVVGSIVSGRLCIAYKGGKFLKKLWCCVGGSITR